MFTGIGLTLVCLAVIWGGVCEKHPKIRIGFLESGGGWIVPWLDRMDRQLRGPVYIAGMAEFVLLSHECDRFPYAPPPLKSDPGDARTVAPATPAPAAVADAVFSLLTM